MRFKAVPPTPPSEVVDEGDSATRDHDSGALEALATVRDALPLVPRSEDDCCARVVDRVRWIEDRDVATEWILFLRALGLAEHSDAGYSRAREEANPNAVVDRFGDRILGARELLDAIGDAAEPATVEAAFGAVENVVPEWERRRNDAWEETWLIHTERLLAWATLLGLAEQRDGGYVRA